MTDPAGGPVAASAAIAVTAGPMYGLGTMMPPGASIDEFIWGCLFAILGAFCYQFIAAQVARQMAADAHVPEGDMPRVDIRTLGYSMCGAPLSAAMLIFIIHYFHGTAGFGDVSFFKSVAGFMASGAAGPKIVIKAVATIVTFVGSRISTGGKGP